MHYSLLQRVGRQQGFTLIELIIVIAIIGVLSTIVIVQFSGNNESDAIQNAESFVVADIRQVLTMAQGGATCCGGATPTGYGIVFEHSANTYTLYADIDSNNEYTPGSDTVLSTVDFSKERMNGVRVANCSPNDAGTCDLLFTVPSAQVYANGATGTNVQIELRHDDEPTLAETITVNSTSGQISSSL